MLWRWSPFVIAEVAAAAGIIVMAIYFPWRDLNRRASLIGVTLLLVCSLWMLAHAIEIGLAVPSYKSYLMGAQLIWGTIALSLWLLYIVHQIGPEKWKAKRVFVLLGIMPLISLSGVVSNPIHHLIWIKPGLDSQNPYLPLQPTYGIVYWICIVYSVVLVYAGSFLLIKKVVRSHYTCKKESAIVLIAAVLPILATLTETLGLSSSLKLSIGITPWVSFISTIILVWTLPRFHLRDVIPFARDTVFERIEDSIIVLDKRDRVLDLNPAAERLLGRKISEVLGYFMKQILPQWPDQVGIVDKRIQSGKEIVLERGGEQRAFNLSVSVASDPDGHSTSKVVLLADITYRKQAEEERQRNADQLLNALKATIESISKITEIRDPYTAGHQNRVAQLAFVIAGEMGLPKDKAEAIKIAAGIHDIGKICVPSEILSKPCKLSEHEFYLIKQHPQTGFEILKNIEFPWPIAQSILQHHERTNGSGYPSGLSGEAIIIEARILAVADVVEAMASHRPYRPAVGMDKALEEINKNKGTLYDASVVDACLRQFMEKGFKFE